MPAREPRGGEEMYVLFVGCARCAGDVYGGAELPCDDGDDYV